jgi:acetylornithine deacetylase/succinyl-diaminopimelate desuccinylase-like protein
MIEGGTHWSIVPDRCVVRLERRTIPGESITLVMQEIQNLLSTLKEENSDFNAEPRCVVERPALETAPTEQIARELKHAIVDITNREATAGGVPYWTDGAILAHSASISTCIFGPGDINVAHSPDEYVNVEDVLRAADVYGVVAQRFCA